MDGSTSSVEGRFPNISAVYDALSDLPLGYQVGDYCIVSVLGRGSSGTVYGAVHSLIGKRAAIKVLEPNGGGRREVERFIQEARAVNEISHPGVVDVFDCGLLSDGRPYLVMERLEGQPMDVWLRSVRPNRRSCAAAAIQIADALEAAHRSGVIHRDLKPANVFLADNGRRMVLLDFGLAKLPAESGLKITDTRTGAFMGTPAYVAPEQALGNGADERSDIYSLGVLLFVAFTGHRPFEKESAIAVAMAHVSDPVPDPRDYAPDLAPELVALIRSMMAKNPAGRPGLDEVRRVLQGPTTAAGNKRRGTAIAAALAAAGALALGVLGGALLGHRSDRERAQSAIDIGDIGDIGDSSGERWSPAASASFESGKKLFFEPVRVKPRRRARARDGSASELPGLPRANPFE